MQPTVTSAWVMRSSTSQPEGPRRAQACSRTPSAPCICSRQRATQGSWYFSGGAHHALVDLLARLFAGRDRQRHQPQGLAPRRAGGGGSARDGPARSSIASRIADDSTSGVPSSSTSTGTRPSGLNSRMRSKSARPTSCGVRRAGRAVASRWQPGARTANRTSRSAAFEPRCQSAGGQRPLRATPGGRP